MNDDKKKERPSGIVLGMCIGLAIGTAVGAATNNIGTWMPIGLALGIAIGASFNNNDEDSQDSDSDKGE